MARETLLSSRSQGRGYFLPGAIEGLFKPTRCRAFSVLWGGSLESAHARAMAPTLCGWGDGGMKAIRTAPILKLAAKALYHTRLIHPLSVTAGYVRRHAAFQILTYHRVNDERDPFFPSILTNTFKRHMAYVARAYRVLTVEELVER